MRLLLTRPEPECERTAALLCERGHQVLRLPLLRIEPLADAELGAGPWAAVLFTSANAIRAIAAHRRFNELANLPVYAVGRRTKAAAAAAGFASVMSADGDVNALVGLVASMLPIPDRTSTSPGPGSATGSSPLLWGEGSGVWIEPEGTATPQRPYPPNLPLLYCAGEDRAGDPVGALQSRGLRVETALVYRATMVTELTPDIRTAFVSGAIDAVLHYSARTAATFVAAAARAGIGALAIQNRHLCLSTQVAGPLAAAGAKVIEVASEPTEQALFALIGRT
jgi:uroporphyrinogen-III synthase